MKAKHTSLSLLLAGIALSAEPATQPQPPDDPSIVARQAVESQLLTGLQNRGSLHLFSRVGPPPPPKLEFAAVQTIDGEARLPFTITYGRRKASIQGYVRTKDHAVFLVDAATGKAIPALGITFGEPTLGVPLTTDPSVKNTSFPDKGT